MSRQENMDISLNITENTDYQDYEIRIVSIPLWYYTTICVCLTSFAINGILLNGLVIRGFTMNKKNRAPYNLIVLNLTIAEFAIAFFGITLDVQALVNSGWLLGKTLCVATGTLVTTAGFVSITSLCVLSVCRFGSIFRFGNTSENVSSHGQAAKIILGIWLYSLGLSLPPLFGWGRYVPELSGLACAPDWHTEKKNVAYVIYLLLFGFMLPTLVIISSSLLTCAEARVIPRRPAFKKNKRNFQLVLGMTVCYLVCWSPYAILCMIHNISESLVGPMLSLVPTVTVKMSVCINPLLYIAANPQFHGSFARANIDSYKKGSKMRQLRKLQQKKYTEKKLEDVKDDKLSNEASSLKVILTDMMKASSIRSNGMPPKNVHRKTKM